VEQRILGMMTHLDDAEFLMGGTIVRLTAVEHGYTFVESFHHLVMRSVNTFAYV
jgi:hypothetical protein